MNLSRLLLSETLALSILVAGSLACVVPYDGMVITADTTICKGEYNLPNGLTTNFFSGSNIVLDCNESTFIGNGSGSGFYLSKGHEWIVKNCAFTNYTFGIDAWDSGKNVFVGNTFEDNYYGMYFDSCSSQTIKDNKFQNNHDGLFIFWYYSKANVIENNQVIGNNRGIVMSEYSNQNLVYNNTVINNTQGIISDCRYGSNVAVENTYTNNMLRNNTYGLFVCGARNSVFAGNLLKENSNGIYLTSGQNNTLYANKFVDNDASAYSSGTNYWDWNDQGNYWSDYDTPLEGCTDSNSNGICDSPYTIPGGSSKDNLPYVNPDGWQTKPICNKNSQCGDDHWINYTICVGKDLYDGYRTYTCNNPGSTLASCTYSDIAKLKRTCPAGCSNGACSVDFQKGFSLTSWWYNDYLQPQSDTSLERLKADGVEWVSILVTQYQNTTSSKTISPLTSKTPTDAAIAHAINKAHSLGMKVILKPHVDVLDGSWRGSITFSNEADWQAWFSSYASFINHYADLAQANGVEAFIVGTEFKSASGHESDWRNIVNGVRSRFSGLITYAANHDEYQNVTWWDAVDFIGIDAYFALTGKTDPTVAELVAAWAPYKSAMTSFSTAKGKPIVFTEIGYQSINGTNMHPWWSSGSVDLQEQADCYQAAFISVYNESWFKGVYWWMWYWNPTSDINKFDVYNKPAEGIVSDWYGGAPIACHSNSDCGTDGWVGSDTCNGKDVWNTWRAYTCQNPGTVSASCTSTNTTKLKTTCPVGCSAGACAIACYSDSDCGTNGWSGLPYCTSKDVYQDWKIYMCNNPGTTSALCASLTASQLKQICASGCSNGACISGTCLTPTDGMNLTGSAVLCNGNYYLPHGINVSGDDVTLDCNGSIIRGDSSAYGIYSVYAGNGYADNIVVRNCELTLNQGISLFANNVLVENNSVDGEIVLQGTGLTITKNNCDKVEAHYSDDVTISDNILNGLDHLIRLYDVSGASVSNNQISGYASWGRGISLDTVKDSVFENNTVWNGGSAIYCWSLCRNNVIRDNSIMENAVAIFGDATWHNTTMYRNDLIDNTQDVKGTFDSSNVFDYGGEGNYWSKYDTPAEGCNDANSDGMCDSPYVMPSGNTDNYPLTSPIGPSPICSSNSDCGTDGWVGTDTCNGKDVWNTWRAYTCNNAGTTSASCTSSDASKLKQTCPDACLAGKCTVSISELAKDTWTYLSSDWATNNHLPWSWRSSRMSGGDYANPAEVGFYMLSWIGAYDMQQSWSPTWSQTEAELTAVLNQLEAWQSGTQPTYGPHAYNGSVFYQDYWISWTPPRVGGGTYDHVVSAIDNAWLATSLITIEEYAKANGRTILATKAQNILKDMDFSLWYHQDVHLFSWGAYNNPQGGGYCDYYSNENRIINFVAYALGDINESEFRASLAALHQGSATYNGITVDKVNWDGSYFTYAAPALFIKEADTQYGEKTIDKATQAQITYAGDKGYPAWGISDCFDKLSGAYVARGAPPRGSGSSSSDPDTGLITPHASALALNTGYSSQAASNLFLIASTYPASYNATYGFYDSVDVKTGEVSYRFAALDQEWIFLSLMDKLDGTIWDYFYKDSGVQEAHAVMFNVTVCGSTINSCVGGVLDDIPDNSTHYLWKCVGNDGTISCSAKRAACYVNSDCGTDNWVGTDTCNGKDVWNTWRAYTCQNAGTASASCKYTDTSKLKETCSGACSNGACINITCFKNSDCGTNGWVGNDTCNGKSVIGTWRTYSCKNAGTATATCAYTDKAKKKQACPIGCESGVCTIECYADADCGINTWIKADYCSGRNVWNKWATHTCLKPGTIYAKCKYTAKAMLKEACVNGTCSAGKCVPVACFKNADCGTNGWVGNDTCNGKNVWNVWRTYKCKQPGKATASCTYTDKAKKKQTCPVGCDSGACTIACYSDADCGTNGWLNKNYCSGGNVWDKWRAYICKNPGTISAKCSYKDSSKLKEDCPTTCSSGICS